MYPGKTSIFLIIFSIVFTITTIELKADLISEHYQIIKKKRYKKHRYHRKHRRKKHKKKKVAAATAGTAVVLSQEQQWQEALKWLGLYQGERDGNLYSFDTHKAIEAFQTQQGLNTTGFLDERSKAYLSYIYNISVLSNHLNYTGRDEKMLAKKYQTALKVLGFYHGKVDGVIGKETEKVIQRYKQAYGLDASTSDLSEAEKYTLVEEAKTKLSQEYRTFKSENILSDEVHRNTPSSINNNIPRADQTKEENVLSEIDAFLNEEDSGNKQKAHTETKATEKSTPSMIQTGDPVADHISDITVKTGEEVEKMIELP